jgi:hypothetical protein
MFGLGIIGYYLAKIYEEIKFRPRYIVNERTGGARTRLRNWREKSRRSKENTENTENTEETNKP